MYTAVLSPPCEAKDLSGTSPRHPRCLDVCSLPSPIPSLVVGFHNGSVATSKRNILDALGDVGKVRWSPDGSHVLVAVGDDVFLVYETNALWTRKLAAKHDRDVEDVRWGFDSKSFVSCGLDSRVVVWSLDLATHAVKQMHAIQAQGEVKALAYDPAGGRYLAACVKNLVVVWATKDATEFATVKFKYPTAALDWSPDGKYLMVGLENGAVFVMDRQNLDHPIPISKSKRQGRIIHHMKFSPVLYRSTVDRQIISTIVAVGDLKGISLYLLKPNLEKLVGEKTELNPLLSIKGEKSPQAEDVEDLSFSSDGKKLYVCSQTFNLGKFELNLPTSVEPLTPEATREILETEYHGFAANEIFIENPAQKKLEVEVKRVEIELAAASAMAAMAAKVAAAAKVVVVVAEPKPAQVNKGEAGSTGSSQNGEISHGGAGAPVAAIDVPSPAASPMKQKETITKEGRKRIQPISTQATTGDLFAASAMTSTTSTTTAAFAASNITTTNTPSATNSMLKDEDCEKCKFCLDKPKFGGRNVLKQRCMNRPPINMVLGAGGKRAKISSAASFLSDDNGTATMGDDLDLNQNLVDAVEDDLFLWNDGSSSEEDLDSENEDGFFVLSTNGGDVVPESISLGPGNPNMRFRKFAMQPEKRIIVSCVNYFDEKDASAHEVVLWSTTLRGRIEYCRGNADFVAIATTTRDLFVYRVKSGITVGSPFALGSKCAFLNLKRMGKDLTYCVAATRDGRFFIWSLNGQGCKLLDSGVLTPLVEKHGKPFLLTHESSIVPTLSAGQGGATRARKRTCILSFSQKGVLVLSVADKSDIMDCACYAYAGGQPKTWVKILEPLRYLGSEYCTLHRLASLGGSFTSVAPNITTAGGEVETLHKTLLLTSAFSTSASTEAAKALSSAGIVSQTTIGHLESLIFACKLLESEREEKFWMETLFDHFTRDVHLSERVRWWVKEMGKSPLKANLLLRLSKNRQYQGLIEEFDEEDVSGSSSGMQE